jgi:hypothetical protein
VPHGFDRLKVRMLGWRQFTTSTTAGQQHPTAFDKCGCLIGKAAGVLLTVGRQCVSVLQKGASLALEEKRHNTFNGGVQVSDAANDCQ